MVLSEISQQHLQLFVTVAIIGWIAMNFGIHIQVPFMINCHHFGNPLTFHVTSLSGQIFICNLY